MDGMAIECRRLTKRFGSVTAVDQLDLTVPEGRIVGFLGPNGAGKTTTLRILAGLSRATSGQAWVAGQEVALNSTALQRGIGYLPDQPAFYGWMNAREYLTFVGALFGMDRAEIARRRDQLLELVDLAEVSGRRIGGFSRGMKQRLGIAQALMNRPRVLLMDEPSSALDPVGRLEVLETMLRLKEQQTTIFLSTHILADAERVCDEIAVIDRGHLLVQATVDELRQRYATPVFEMEFEEPASSFISTLLALPWVERLDAERQNSGLLKVHVGDTGQAKVKLPGVIADSGLTLRRYELVLPTLEDIFVKLVGTKRSRP